MAMPRIIFGAFSRDQELIAVGTSALRYMVLLLPLVGYQVVGSGLFQALGKALEALVLSLTRQVLILIPMVIVLPILFGITGVWLSMPFSDALSFTLTLILVIVQLRKIEYAGTDGNGAALKKDVARAET
jgi:Na+-driven multidrug efflux pump